MEAKEQLRKNGQLLPPDWSSQFTPHSFIDLISDGQTNRVFMKWLSQWKPSLFHVPSPPPPHVQTKENESTTELDSLPFYCPECHQGGHHSARCTSKPPLRPYFAPDLPSPLPTRPFNPLLVLSGPVACGKSSLVQVAARAHHLRVVSFAGELAGVSTQRTLQEVKDALENKGIEFGTSSPPLLLFVALFGICEL